MFGVDYPVVQTGMDWGAGPLPVVAAAEAGGLGTLASAVMPLDELKASIAQIRDSTDCNFGVSVSTDSPDIDLRIDHLISSRVRVVSFAQTPHPDMVKKLRDGGVIVMAEITTGHHAEEVAELGVDVITLLLPQVLDAVDNPVIAVGGFHDGRGLAAALAWGADGIAIDGAPRRVIRTEAVEHLEARRITRLTRAVTNAIRFRKSTPTSGVVDVGDIGDLPSFDDIISRMVVDAVGRLDHLSA